MEAGSEEDFRKSMILVRPGSAKNNLSSRKTMISMRPGSENSNFPEEI